MVRHIIATLGMLTGNVWWTCRTSECAEIHLPIYHLAYSIVSIRNPFPLRATQCLPRPVWLSVHVGHSNKYLWGGRVSESGLCTARCMQAMRGTLTVVMCSIRASLATTTSCTPMSFQHSFTSVILRKVSGVVGGRPALDMRLTADLLHL